MMQIDGYIHVENLLDEALIDETGRVWTLYRMVSFVKGDT